MTSVTDSGATSKPKMNDEAVAFSGFCHVVWCLDDTRRFFHTAKEADNYVALHGGKTGAWRRDLSAYQPRRVDGR